MFLKEFGHFLGILDMAFHSQAEGFKPLQEQPGIERRKGRTKITQDLNSGFQNEGWSAQSAVDQPVIGRIGVIEVGEARIVFPFKVTAVHNDAADRSAMTADKLGGRMGNNVDAPFKRPEEVRGGEGVVDYHGDTEFFTDFNYFFEGEDVNQRVTQSFAVQSFGVGFDGFAEFFRFAGIDEGDIYAQFGEGISELVVGAALQGGSGNDMVPGAQNGEESLELGSMT